MRRVDEVPRFRSVAIALALMVVAVSCGGSGQAVSTNVVESSVDQSSDDQPSDVEPNSGQTSSDQTSVNEQENDSTEVSEIAQPTEVADDANPDNAAPENEAVVDAGEPPAVELVSGTTKVGGDYSILMRGPVSVSVEQNPSWPITTTIYEWSDGDRQMRFAVSDSTEHIDGGDDPDMQESLAAFAMFDISYTAEVVSDSPISFAPGGPETALAGHEIRFKVGGSDARLRFIRKDQIGYAMTTVGLSDAEFDNFADSLVPQPYEERDLDTEAAELAANESAVAAAGAFVEGPYPSRDLPAGSGGWGYIHAPPEGAEVPGVVPELDPLFVECREGDGGKCDELYWASVTGFGSDGLNYEAFADTCGGRTLTERCTDLLGGVVPAEGDPFDELEQTPFYSRNRQLDLTAIPPPESAPPGEDLERDALWVECGQMVSEACRDLRIDAPTFGPIDIYEAFGHSCGGRLSKRGQGCDVVFGVLGYGQEFIESEAQAPGLLEPEADELWDLCTDDPSEGCSSLFFFLIETPGKDQSAEEDAAEAPYLFWARTCGGRIDYPVVLTSCNDYRAWPTVS